MSSDPHQPTRPNRRSTGGSESTLRSVTDWQVKNPNSSVRIRVSKYFTRETRTDRIIYNKKKKEDLTSVDSVHHMPRTAHAQQCQPETQSKLFPHTFPTWISAVHLKLKFKINGVDERKTEHDMTSYGGKITHSKSTVIIQRWRANLTVRIKWERSSISKTLTSLFTLQFSLQRQSSGHGHGFPFTPPPPLFTLPHLFSLHFFSLRLSVLYLLSQTLTISHSIRYKPFLQIQIPKYKP